jgi:hypothetical protein
MQQFCTPAEIAINNSSSRGRPPCKSMILLNSSRACQVHSLLLVLEPQQQAAAGRLRGLTSVLGSAVAGAAKVAGASAAAIAAAGGPLIVTVPEPSQAVSPQGSSRVGTVRLTKPDRVPGTGFRRCCRSVLHLTATAIATQHITSYCCCGRHRTGWGRDQYGAWQRSAEAAAAEGGRW